MPTASTVLAPSPSRPLSKENLRTRSILATSSGALAAATAEAGVQYMKVVASWLLKVGRSVPEALAIAVSAAVASGVLACISASVSYQAPTSALPRSGFSFSTLVLTTIRSRISPGVLLESNTSELSLSASTSESCGFQVTVAVTAGAA